MQVNDQEQCDTDSKVEGSQKTANPGNSCFVCSKTGNLQICLNCKSIYYCSSDCQIKDWIRHMQDCLKNHDQEEPKLEATESETASCSGQCCFVCRQSENVKRCSTCKKIYYCSVECQRKDFGRHKANCTSHILTYEHLKDVYCKTGIAFTDDRPFLPLINFSALTNDEELSKQASVSDHEFFLAIDCAQQFYPTNRIIFDLKIMPSENLGKRPGKTCNVLVAFISRYHHFRQRHSIYVQGKYKEELYVAFYLDFDSPLPFFDWGDLKPGRFICIQDPCRHYFMDGSIGIRVDEAKAIKVFDVDK